MWKAAIALTGYAPIITIPLHPGSGCSLRFGMASHAQTPTPKPPGPQRLADPAPPACPRPHTYTQSPPGIRSARIISSSALLLSDFLLRGSSRPAAALRRPARLPSLAPGIGRQPGPGFPSIFALLFRAFVSIFYLFFRALFFILHCFSSSYSST